MKLRVFQARKGDCLLLTSASGANVLIDGGMRDAFLAHVQPHLAAMARKNEVLDLVYVSHIDQDHISGVLQLLHDTMAWRVHDYRKANALATKAPASPRMPVVNGIWHNAFSDLIGKNAAPAGDLLAQSAALLAHAVDIDWQALASEHHELAYSVAEAIQVSRRIGADQLSIPLNQEFDGRLVMVRSPAGPEATIGGMSIRVLGPFEEDVENLKADWNAWLRDNKAIVAKLRAKALEDAGKIGQAIDGVGAVELMLKQLGNRSKVTAPNLASVMLLVEEAGRRIVLTGDGHADDVVAGLEHQGILGADGIAHMDVLKIQHHGSEHNINEEFCRRVIADHYVLCGNGEHENPDLDAVELLMASNEKYRPDAHYKLWFNCDAVQAPAGKPLAHMKKLVAQVNKRVAGSGGRVKAAFLAKSSFLIQ